MTILGIVDLAFLLRFLDSMAFGMFAGLNGRCHDPSLILNCHDTAINKYESQ